MGLEVLLLAAAAMVLLLAVVVPCLVRVQLDALIRVILLATALARRGV
jgi:hypothetical protein